MSAIRRNCGNWSSWPRTATLQALPVATVPQSQAYEALMRLRDGKVTGRLVLKAEAVS